MKKAMKRIEFVDVANFINEAINRNLIVYPRSEDYYNPDDSIDFRIRIYDPENVKEYNFILDGHTLIFSSLYGEINVDLTISQIHQYQVLYDKVIEYSQKKTTESFISFFNFKEKDTTIYDLDEED